MIIICGVIGIPYFALNSGISIPYEYPNSFLHWPSMIIDAQSWAKIWILNALRLRDCSMVEFFPIIHEVLNLIPSTTKYKAKDSE